MRSPDGVELSAPEARPAAPEDEIVFAVSHDLRGPLLNFQGFLRRLASACEALEGHAQNWELPAAQRQLCDDLVQQKIRPSLEVLERNARRMDSLLNALLELSRAGREPPQLQRVAAGPIAQAVIEELRAHDARMAAAPRGELRGEVQVELRVDPLPELWADPERLAMIYRQLLGNALKFLSAARPGQISLGGEATPKQTVCWVRDNGIGIKPQHQGRIFTPFGRVREIDAPGEGVGLPICRKLMGQMGGRIAVESAHGEGATFYLVFPGCPAANGRSAKEA
ncbi:MAG TPA: HAMP domain-containing sensor histidine kinase [Bryobacterales bacterium]|nr:HAMP domain-containing sensor histidine kinase [Bryobacterales bacterium]